MDFDIDINLKWFRGISKPKNLQSLLATELGLDIFDTFVFLIKVYNTIPFFFFTAGDNGTKLNISGKVEE